MTDIRLILPSISLLRPVEIRAALPYGSGNVKRPYKVVWALHCSMAGGGIFFDSLNAVEIAERQNVAIIAPSLGNGYFINSLYEKQADFLDEMLMAMRDLLPLSHNREDNALIGISMGGFGALHWALRSGSFANVAILSGVFDCEIPPDGRIRQNRDQKIFYQLFSKIMRGLMIGEDHKPLQEYDFELAFSKSEFIPNVNLYCGNDDFLSLPQHRFMENICRDKQIIINSQFLAGGHDKAFWRSAFSLAIDDLFQPRPKN